MRPPSRDASLRVIVHSQGIDGQGGCGHRHAPPPATEWRLRVGSEHNHEVVEAIVAGGAASPHGFHAGLTGRWVLPPCGWLLSECGLVSAHSCASCRWPDVRAFDDWMKPKAARHRRIADTGTPPRDGCAAGGTKGPNGPPCRLGWDQFVDGRVGDGTPLRPPVELLEDRPGPPAVCLPRRANLARGISQADVSLCLLQPRAWRVPTKETDKSRRSQFGGGQTMAVLKKQESGGSTKLYNWRGTLGRQDVSDDRKQKTLEDENARPKRRWSHRVSATTWSRRCRAG